MKHILRSSSRSLIGDLLWLATIALCLRDPDRCGSLNGRGIARGRLRATEWLRAPLPFLHAGSANKPAWRMIMANIEGDSPQAVAFALLEKIAAAEDWSQVAKTYPQKAAQYPWSKTRAEILDTYAECLLAVTKASSAQRPRIRVPLLSRDREQPE
jgi:hypothetical protein